MFLWDVDMYYLSYSAYIFNLLFIALFEWRSNRIIKCLPIANPGSAGSKPLGSLWIGQSKEYQEVLGT